MSAIKPHLETQNDPSVTAAEEQANREAGSAPQLRGLGTVYPISPAQLEYLQTSHAELIRVTWTRQAIYESLANKSFELEFHEGELKLRLNEPVGRVPPWNPPGAGDMRRATLLSWTQKMGTPSFSLPAGPPLALGSCPGANAAQSITPDNKTTTNRHLVLAVTGREVSLPDTVCQKCYATGGNYGYGSTQFVQLLRYTWARQLVERGKASEFIEAMVWAIQNADYRRKGGVYKPGKGEAGVDESGKLVKVTAAIVYEPEVHPGRYFRIHDSGDFFSAKYLRAWKEIAEHFNTGDDATHITFWAPTRIWATSWGRDAVNEINRPRNGRPSNLVIRPSAYHLNEPPPVNFPNSDDVGWSHWSVVYHTSHKAEWQHTDRAATGQAGVFTGAPYHWDCQAYAVLDEAHSCRNARAPGATGLGDKGDVGCRACWVHTGAVINYTEH